MIQKRLLSLELRMMVRQRSYLAALICFTLLALWAFYVGLATMQERARVTVALEAEQTATLQRAAETALQSDRGLMTPGQFRDPRDVSNFVRVVLNTPVIKPVHVAEVLSPRLGTDPSWYYNLNLGLAAKSLTTYEYSNPEIARYVRLDLNVLLVSLAPLFLSFVGFPVWTSDREVHIDRLVKLGSTSSERVYAWRLLLYLAPFCCVYALLGGAALLLADAPGISPASRLASLLLFAGVTLLYTAFWWVCIYFVLRSSTYASAALARLLFLWLFVVVLVPALAQWHARAMYPQPSRSALIDQSRSYADDVAKHNAAVQQRYMSAHTELHLAPDALRQISSGATALITAEANDDLSAKQADDAAGRLVKQDRVVRLWSLLSPALLAQESLRSMAGESASDAVAFQTQAKQYLAELRDFYRPMLFSSPAKSSTAVQRYVAYPRFRASTHDEQLR